MQTADVIVIGGGSAGLGATQYVARANLSVILVENLALGGQGLNIEALENYPGFPEPISGADFFDRMREQAERFGAKIVMATAKRLTKTGDTFTLETDTTDISATAVILATGAKHRLLGIPGEQELSGSGVSYCATCDGPFFRNKRILVVGGGDAACDEATFLTKLTDQVVLIHRRERFRAQGALAERVLSNPKIEVRFNTEALEIRGDKKVEEVVLKNNISSEAVVEPFGAVFIFVGSYPQNELVPDLPVDEGGYVITNDRMETELPGLFVVGDVRSSPFKQIVVSAGEGAVAAHCAAQYIDNIRGNSYVK